MEFAVTGPRLVLVAGGSASGKTALVEELARQLGPRRAVVLCHDWYYIDLSHRPLREREAFDFDSPGALDTQRLLADLRRLLAGEPIAAPVYRFTDHCRDSATRAIEPRPLLPTLASTTCWETSGSGAKICTRPTDTTGRSSTRTDVAWWGTVRKDSATVRIEGEAS